MKKHIELLNGLLMRQEFHANDFYMISVWESEVNFQGRYRRSKIEYYESLGYNKFVKTENGYWESKGNKNRVNIVLTPMKRTKKATR